MDLSFLDKASGVMPILVRLYDNQKLYALAKEHKPEARAELAASATELLSLSLAPRETELITDILIELVRQAEADLKQTLSERLAGIDSAPLRLVLQLANDEEISVARPVLQESTVLGDLDLIYIIKSRGAEHWREIATRKILSENLTDILAETGDVMTAVKLAENRNIKLGARALSALSDMAQGQEILAAPLLRREEIPASLAQSLYQYVGTEMKAYISQRFEGQGAAMTAAAQIAVQAIDEITAETVAELSGITLPGENLMSEAQRFLEKGLLTMPLMLKTLKKGHTRAFIAQFAKFTGLEPQIVLEMIRQRSGQGVAVACRALGVLRQDFISLFLLTARLRSDGGMLDARDIQKAIEYYNRLTPEMAQGILKGSRK